MGEAWVDNRGPQSEWCLVITAAWSIRCSCIDFCTLYKPRTGLTNQPRGAKSLGRIWSIPSNAMYHAADAPALSSRWTGHFRARCHYIPDQDVPCHAATSRWLSGLTNGVGAFAEGLEAPPKTPFRGRSGQEIVPGNRHDLG